MKKNVITILLLLMFQNLIAQNTDKDFLKTYSRINSKKIFNLDKSKLDKYKMDSLEIIEMQQLLDFFNKYLNDEHKLNGKAGFSFNGNENDINNLFKIGVNGSIDKGVYPYEVDFSLNAQTTIQDGVFQENLSDIDVSFDFHPYIPKVNSSSDGLWLENYVFVKRFNNNFLGIEQRYETGAGFIFNFFSKKHLTKKGKDNLKGLEKIPQYEKYGKDLKRCLDSCYIRKSILKITDKESQTIVNTRERYERSNYKRYSKLRLALLIGIYHEIENSIAKNELEFNGIDTLLTENFETTNKLRWEFRPTIVWQPKDKYKLKVYPYFKMPFGNGQSIVEEGTLKDSRYDYFVDLLTSFEIEIEKNFSISINYRMLYDNAPKRKYIEQDDGSFALLVGQKKNSNYGVTFKFGF